MNQENVIEKNKKIPRKTTWTEWVLSAIILLLSASLMWELFRHDPWNLPWNLTRLEGTVVILDENGEAIPSQEIWLTLYSRFPPPLGIPRFEPRRKRFFISDQGFSDGLSFLMANSSVTLFFHDARNEKYAAVIDIDHGAPTTGLVFELRPRHSAVGRLVDHSGAPLANHVFSLDFTRISDVASDRGVSGYEKFESEYSVTDADGFFTIDRLIPGVEYRLTFHRPKFTRHISVKMPIL